MEQVMKQKWLLAAAVLSALSAGRVRQFRLQSEELVGQ
jgi:hypothetical protein